MIVPHTYSEWVDILNLLSCTGNNQEVLDAMQRGTLEVQLGVYPRFINKLLTVIQLRIDKANDQFNNNIHYANSNMNMIVKALLSYRKELCFLVDIANISAIRTQDQEKLVDLIQDGANQIQESIEKSIQYRTSKKLLMIIKENWVNKLNTGRVDKV